jgi:hypothetical protein
MAPVASVTVPEMEEEMFCAPTATQRKNATREAKNRMVRYFFASVKKMQGAG